MLNKIEQAEKSPIDDTDVRLYFLSLLRKHTNAIYLDFYEAVKIERII